MAMGGLPDMYTESLRVYISGGPCNTIKLMKKRLRENAFTKNFAKRSAEVFKKCLLGLKISRKNCCGLLKIHEKHKTFLP